MEIIRIAGYTEDEKLEIAKRHLLPKPIEHHGLDKKEFEVSDDALQRGHPLLHPRGGRAHPRTRDHQAGAQGGEGPMTGKVKGKKVTVDARDG